MELISGKHYHYRQELNRLGGNDSIYDPVVPEAYNLLRFDLSR